MATQPVTDNVEQLRFVAPADLLESIAADDWSDLAHSASEPNPFFERWFVGASIAHLPLPSDLRFFILTDAHGRLDGLMPLSGARRYGRLPVTHMTNHFHHNVFLGTPLIRAGQERVFWEALLTALDEAPWASGFLRLSDLVEGGPVISGLTATPRRCDTIYRAERAFLESTLTADAYYAAVVRKKKRKEIKRLQSRLAELGNVNAQRLTTAEGCDTWSDAFLLLEKSGWKGDSGSALGKESNSETFFRAMIRDGLTAGRIEILKFSCDDKPLAILINFMTLPGSFSFKIAYDEDYARYSPGVLIQLENLKLLERQGFGWMDSCATPDHPMINSLWAERRTIVWKALPLAGFKRSLTFRCARLAEAGWDAFKAWRSPKQNVSNDNKEESDD
jgi:CelD/BcsL family acetyltransferase involved in cellulose biosynthesis